MQEHLTPDGASSREWIAATQEELEVQDVTTISGSILTPTEPPRQGQLSLASPEEEEEERAGGAAGAKRPLGSSISQALVWSAVPRWCYEAMKQVKYVLRPYNCAVSKQKR